MGHFLTFIGRCQQKIVGEKYHNQGIKCILTLLNGLVMRLSEIIPKHRTRYNRRSLSHKEAFAMKEERNSLLSHPRTEYLSLSYSFGRNSHELQTSLLCTECVPLESKCGSLRTPPRTVGVFGSGAFGKKLGVEEVVK